MIKATTGKNNWRDSMHMQALDIFRMNNRQCYIVNVKISQEENLTTDQLGKKLLNLEKRDLGSQMEVQASALVDAPTTPGSVHIENYMKYLYQEKAVTWKQVKKLIDHGLTNHILVQKFMEHHFMKEIQELIETTVKLRLKDKQYLAFVL